MFSGLLALIVGFFMMASAFICFLTSFIISIVLRNRKNIPVFRQKAGAFIIGSLFQLLFGAVIFIGGLFDDSSVRRLMDKISLFYSPIVLMLSILIIILIFRRVSKKYYPK